MDEGNPTGPRIEIQLEDLRKRNLFIATPAYGGSIHSSYLRSMLALQQNLLQWGIPNSFNFMFNESLISRARNKLADMFLQSDCTDLLFIDSDIQFQPEAVVTLMHYNKDIIGAPYPLKTIDWEAVKRAILNNPEVKLEDLPPTGANWAIRMNAGPVTLEPFKLEPANEIATGFMMIKREVLEGLKSHVPSFKPAGNDHSNPSPIMYDFFPVGVYNDYYESEDYSFCRIAREKVGAKIFLAPWIPLTHFGSYGFEGNMITSARLTGEVK